MAWGVSSVDYKIGGKLSWQRINELMAKAKDGQHYYIQNGRSKNYYLHYNDKSHPKTGKYETARCFRMYNTDILQFFADGAIRIVTFPSGITYQAINQFGPVNCFRSPQIKYREIRRFGSWHGNNYPIPGGTLEIDKHGFVIGKVIDEQTVVDPKKLKERRALAKAYRAKAFPRMMLGEFGDVWAMYAEYRQWGWGRRNRTGWWARVLINSMAQEFCELMLAGSTHPNLYDEILQKNLYRGRPAKSKDHAVRVACDQMMYEGLLTDPKWYTRKVTDYGRVNIHE